ncbi:MAG: galactose-1-phosphate uridylyltransferase, partial [Eubacterium sp.]|nr:galactose-1-phosphate uridylyltransferase [Eubacterium sp.]
MIQESIVKLVQYGLATGLVASEDKRYITNKVLELLEMDAIEEEALQEILAFDGKDQSVVGELESILLDICDYAYEQGLMEENSVVYRDLFDTKVMSLMVDRPSNVIKRFWDTYREDPVKATDAHYKFSQDTDYIRRYRIAKDMKWVAPTEYGDLDITINLSKPEKDPKAIAAAKLAKQTSYPKCLLCMENEGYAGRLNHPARQNHRIIPVTINNSEWGFQYSPYVYYNEHC